jgi:hypothetical protein
MELRTYPSKLRNNLVESILICVGAICVGAIRVGAICPLTEKLRN